MLYVRRRTYRLIQVHWCDGVQTLCAVLPRITAAELKLGCDMYIGGGILGTILVVLFIVYLMRRV